MIKEDIHASYLLALTVGLFLFWPLVKGYLMPLEIAFANPVVFVAAVGQIFYYYYKKHQRRTHRLKFGWTVRGNEII